MRVELSVFFLLDVNFSVKQELNQQITAKKREHGATTLENQQLGSELSLVGGPKQPKGNIDDGQVVHLNTP